MSAADWFLTAAIVFAVAGTAAILGIARWQFNRARVRWTARFARPLTIVHPGEDDSERDDSLRTGCPCCTAQPYTVDDCTCREDCGKRWCQAIDLEIPDWLTGDHGA